MRPLPARPETVAFYLTARADAGRRVATLGSSWRPSARPTWPWVGLHTPRASAVVKEVRKGVRRALGVAPLEKAPADVAVLKALLAALRDTLHGRRDRALLLVGFAGALRRSDLGSLNLGDLAFVEDGLLHPRRSKTDPEARGRKVGIPFGSGPATCPVRVLKAWLAAAGLERGPVFRHRRRWWCRGLPPAASLRGVLRPTELLAENRSQLYTAASSRLRVPPMTLPKTCPVPAPPRFATQPTRRAADASPRGHSRCC